MPQEMFMPSKAGPAAVAEAVKRPLTARANSPLVPISMNRVAPPSAARSGGQDTGADVGAHIGRDHRRQIDKPGRGDCQADIGMPSGDYLR